jgi:hypothetical protein
MTMLLFAACAPKCFSGWTQTVAESSPATQSEARVPSASKDARSFDKNAPPEASNDKPLPDIAAMMHDVETNQRKAEAMEKYYIYHSVATEQQMDGHGQIKKTKITESDHYWVNGVPVRRMLKRDGKDLSPEEIARQDESIDKMAAKAREKREKADAEGKQTDPGGHEEITVARLLELGAFTNPRRLQLNGRPTIAVDYTGDPKAKTRNSFEGLIRQMAGTVWVDDQDHVLVRVDGRFLNAFKIGGGLIVSIQKDTRFSMIQTKVNDEVWLPARFEGQGAIRAILFFSFNGAGQIVNSDYRKFRATSTILPGVTRVGTPEVPNGSAQP